MGRFCSKYSIDFDFPAYDEDPALYLRCIRLVSTLAWFIYRYNPNCCDRTSFMRRLDDMIARANRFDFSLPKRELKGYSEEDEPKELPF